MNDIHLIALDDLMGSNRFAGGLRAPGELFLVRSPNPAYSTNLMKSPITASSLVVLLIFFGVSCTSSSQNSSETKAMDETEAASAGYAEEAAEVTPVLTGTRIPDVAVRDIEGDSVRLRSLVNQKPTVLIFYRGGWCPYCNKHMAELQQVENQLVEMGYRIAAISPDRPELLKESLNEHDLSYSLFSDSPMTAAKAFGLAFRLDDETFNRYKNNGMDLTARSGYDHHLLPVPAVFLVDTEGMIRFQYVNPDYKVRVKSRVLLAAAEAYLPVKD